MEPKINGQTPQTFRLFVISFQNRTEAFKYGLPAARNSLGLRNFIYRLFFYGHTVKWEISYLL